jgi:hypothetical protein
MQLVGAFAMIMLRLLRAIAKNAKKEAPEKIKSDDRQNERTDSPDDPINVKRALESGDLNRANGFLQEVEKVIAVLGDMLDSRGRSEYQLKATRRRRGRPRDDFKAVRDSIIRMALLLALTRLGKLEAALSEVGCVCGLSRATLLRIWKS